MNEEVKRAIDNMFTPRGWPKNEDYIALEKENKRLREGLEEYGQHKVECELFPSEVIAATTFEVCDCGLDEALG